MKPPFTLFATWFIIATAAFATAQTNSLELPKTITAGSTLSVSTTGSGKAVLYIVGPAQALRRDLQLGGTVVIGADEIHNAGHYTVALVSPSSTQTAELEVTATEQPATLSFLAKPSRLSVDLRDGISGVVYVFDSFRNLVLTPTEVSFQLSETGGAAQTRTVSTRNGVAWVKLDSAPKAGAARFQASAGNITEKRIVQQVPGEPCNLRMSARKSGERIELETDPLRDCRGNPVPDGSIVTFKETYNGSETSVDVPLKRGVARTNMPAHDGAVISVATGVVMGNEIHWRDTR
jgi:hypothetical protein